MAVIGNLIAILRAQTAPFQKGMGQARKSTDQFTSGIRSASAKLSTFIGIAGGLGVVVGFHKISQSIDRLAKTSQKLGATVETMSRLQFAAEQTGVSVQTFDMAIQRLVRRVAEAAKGTGEAVNALKELGLDARMLAALPLNERLGMIADAMNRVENQGDRVRLTMKLMDSEGVALVNTLALGSEGLRRMAEESDRLGRTIDERTAQAFAMWNDSINRVKGSLVGALAPVMAAIAKRLTAINNFLAENGTAMLEVIKIISGLLISLAAIRAALKAMAAAQAIVLALSGPKGWIQLAVGAAVATAAIGGVNEAFGSLEDDVLKARSALDSFNKKADETADAATDVASAFDMMANAVKDLIDHPMKRLLDQQAYLLILYENGRITIDEFRRATERLKEQMDELTGATEAAAEAQRQLEELQERAERLVESVQTPQERFNKQIEELEDLFKRGLITEETYRRALEKYRKELEDATKQQEEFVAAIEETNQAQTGDFRQVRLRRIAAASPSVQRARSQEALLEQILREAKEMSDRLNNPKPVPIEWN